MEWETLVMNALAMNALVMNALERETLERETLEWNYSNDIYVDLCEYALLLNTKTHSFARMLQEHTNQPLSHVSTPRPGTLTSNTRVHT